MNNNAAITSCDIENYFKLMLQLLTVNALVLTLFLFSKYLSNFFPKKLNMPKTLKSLSLLIRLFCVNRFSNVRITIVST